jgi:high frequency lysogenization protein
MLQAAWLVDQVARRGLADQDAIEASIGSILRIDAPDVVSVFGGLRGVEQGLKQIDRQIGRHRDPTQTRYVINLMQLDGRLQQEAEMNRRLVSGIQQAQALAETLPGTDARVLACLADTYTDTLSRLKPRIMVSGEPSLLEQPENANRIRALLLAGVRAAVLWRQCGGGRVKLLFQSSRIVATAQELLEELYRDPT